MKVFWVNFPRFETLFSVPAQLPWGQVVEPGVPGQLGWKGGSNATKTVTPHLLEEKPIKPHRSIHLLDELGLPHGLGQVFKTSRELSAAVISQHVNYQGCWVPGWRGRAVPRRSCRASWLSQLSWMLLASVTAGKALQWGQREFHLKQGPTRVVLVKSHQQRWTSLVTHTSVTSTALQGLLKQICQNYIWEKWPFFLSCHYISCLTFFSGMTSR